MLSPQHSFVVPASRGERGGIYKLVSLSEMRGELPLRVIVTVKLLAVFNQKL